MYWPHPVVVGISTNLFVWFGVWHVCVVNQPFWGCLMRALYKFCVFVSSRHCRCFEGKYHSLAGLFLGALSYQNFINHRT